MLIESKLKVETARVKFIVYYRDTGLPRHIVLRTYFSHTRYLGQW